MSGLIIKSIVCLFLTSIGFTRLDHHSKRHAFYVSRIQIDLESNPALGTLKVNTYRDDLNSGTQAMMMTNPRPITDSDWESYIHKEILLRVDGTPLCPDLDSLLQMEDIVSFYFSFSYEPPADSLSINVSLLTEIFPDQKNILELKNGEQRYFEVLTHKTQDFKIPL